jgi:hypothetical protein
MESEGGGGREDLNGNDDACPEGFIYTLRGEMNSGYSFYSDRGSSVRSR